MTDEQLMKQLRSTDFMTDEEANFTYMQMVEDNPDKKVKHIREVCYNNLGRYLHKSFDREVCVFIIKHLTMETDKYIISSMLDRLTYLVIPEDMDIGPIVECSKSDKWLIRHSAIQALGSCATPESREALRYYINQDDEKKYSYEIEYANASMGIIGTKEDIPYLEKHVNSRKRDVRLTARAAIEKIETGKYSFEQSNMTPLGERRDGAGS